VPWFPWFPNQFLPEPVLCVWSQAVPSGR